MGVTVAALISPSASMCVETTISASSSSQSDVTFTLPEAAQPQESATPSVNDDATMRDALSEEPSSETPASVEQPAESEPAANSASLSEATYVLDAAEQLNSQQMTPLQLSMAQSLTDDPEQLDESEQTATTALTTDSDNTAISSLTHASNTATSALPERENRRSAEQATGTTSDDNHSLSPANLYFTDSDNTDISSLIHTSNTATSALPERENRRSAEQATGTTSDDNHSLSPANLYFTDSDNTDISSLIHISNTATSALAERENRHSAEQATDTASDDNHSLSPANLYVWTSDAAAQVSENSTMTGTTLSPTSNVESDNSATGELWVQRLANTANATSTALNSNISTEDAAWNNSATTTASLSSLAASAVSTLLEREAQSLTSSKDGLVSSSKTEHEFHQLLTSVLSSTSSQVTQQDALSNSSAVSTTSRAQQLGEQLLDTLRQQVSLQLTQQTQQATIRLDPAHLGQLEIAIRLDGEKLTVQINAEQASVRESLQSSREQLRQLLTVEHGSSVNVDIGQHSSTSQQRQQTYALWQEPAILSANTITTDRVASVSSKSVATGDWLNTVV